ncbi:hypothetical protein SAMN02799630_02355 [Paenibacillus sp. UNCCL117]|uniref:SiaB family protein kinase n=1 Tax=unclassified Paenibacillus TaxID=185978 RepID=UPI0008820AA1|nr:MULTISPECIES: SiaB family protein kinase [unclassified Paenibacillus]SDD18634.1 hypothetical protein SAMN04488602_106231 [Paenibacillus sp. cl123]SFW35292.1 hypothetical protein SAMN02799630_02355 [Paenibacillus sp. UNCCL117]
MINSLFEVQRCLQANRILISFSGKLTQGLIEEYGDAVKKYLEQAERPSSEVRDVFSIFIEQTQNIKNYCSSKEHSPFAERLASSSIVTIGHSQEGHFIHCGNLIENGDAASLSAALDKLIGLDKTELRKLYKEKLREAQHPDASGAGIGLIEMSRKVSSPLSYAITPIDREMSFFTLKAVI